MINKRCHPLISAFGRVLNICLVFTISLLACTNISAKERPNVILIVTDDQGYGDISHNGNPWLKTPNLDRLAQEGISLENYHVDPFCTPTRASLMTGRYCTRIGTWTVTSARQLLQKDEITLANVFSESGYRTGMFGKWHLGDNFPYAPRFRGFEDVVCHLAGGVDEIGNPKENNYFDDIYYRNGVAEKFKGYCTNVFFDETLRFIKEDKEKPFFVYLPLNAMHSPFTAEEKYWKPFAEQGIEEKRSKFFGMIQNFDENLGRLLTTLDKEGIDKETMIIFMGDNGTARGALGIPEEETGYNAGMRGHKGSVYEGGHRVACFIRWPGRLKAQTGIHKLISHRDWFPTLMDLCELKSSQNIAFDGRSLTPLLKGEKTDWEDRTLFVQNQRKSLIIEAPYCVMTERWRLVNGELYDIQKDPSQRYDVSQAHKDVVDQLYSEYKAYFEDVKKEGDPHSRFQIGVKEENPQTLTVRDWFPTKGFVIWEKSQLGDNNLQINGYWPIEIVKAGRYQLTLARHPFDDLKPMEALKAELNIGDLTLKKDLEASAETVSFECELSEGSFFLKTKLVNGESERGAYHVRVTKL